MLMIGSPGAGKTLLARALPGILPAMSLEDSLDVTRIYSVAVQLRPGTLLMRSAMSQMQLSARAYHRILKLARTIADLAGCEEIGPVHLAEALQYRPKVMLA